MKQETPEVVLYWDGRGIDTSTRGIGTLAISFVEIRHHESGAEDVRNPSTGSYDGSPYADLQLHAQWNLDAGCVYSPDCTYGESVYYKDPYRIVKRDAERMVKMFKRLEQVEAKFPIRPATFGQWVVLLCKGLGIKRLCLTENNRGWHNENTHQFLSITDAQGKIDNAIRETFPTVEAKARA